MKKSAVKSLFFVIPALLLLAVAGVLNNPGSNERQEYVDYITNHPYATREVQLDEFQNLPKFDRPDLAAEHNFLQVVDPKLKRIPTERLATAYEETKTLLKQKHYFNSTNQSGISFQQQHQLNEVANEPLGAIPDVNWTERGPNNVGGRTRALMWDPNDPDGTKVWAGSVSGGIWYNNDITDPNSSWFVVNDFLSSLAIASFAYDPNETTTFYAATGEGFIAGNGGGGVAGAGLYKSIDGGDSWSLLPSTIGPDFRYIQKVIVTSPGTLLITTRPSLNEGGTGGVFRSIDGGDSWTSVIGGRGADLQLASNGDIYASTGVSTGTGQVWRSIDDGVNWTEVTPPGGNPLWIELAVAPSQSSETSTTRIYALAQSASTRTTVTWFQRSDDGGETWTDLEVPRYRNTNCTVSEEDFTRGQAFYDLIVAVQPSNADVVTIGGIDIYRSTTAGTDMELVSYWTGGCDDFVHADQHEAVYRPGAPNEAIFGHDGGVSYSSDIGNPSVDDPNFDTRNNNYAVTQFYAVTGSNEVGSGNFLAGAQDNGTQRFTAEGGLTTSQAVGGDGAFCHIDQTDGTFQIASVQFNAVFHSSNGGAFFTQLTGQNNSHGFINPTDLDNQSHILYTRGTANEYMLIRDINTAIPSDEEFVNVEVGTISHINANSTTDHRLFVGSRQGNVYRIDEANTANPTVVDITNNITSFGNVSSIDIGSTDDQLLVTFSNFGLTSVWISTNGGQTWTSKDDSNFGLPDIPVRWGMFNPNNTNQVLLATELGVWSTDDILSDNPGWEPTSSNLANVRCDMLQYRASDGVVMVATFGRGVFTTDAFSAVQDNTPPNLISTNPVDDEEGTLLDAILSASFNEPINAGTGSITIFRSADNSVFEAIDVATANISGATLFLEPSSELEPSTSYYVQMDAGVVTDNNGNAFGGLSDNTTWNFATFDGDFAPTLAQSLGIIRLVRDETSVVEGTVDLSGVFTDPDNNDSEITFAITSNSNPALVGTEIAGSTLTVSALIPNQLGQVELTLEGTSNGKTITDDFKVIIGDPILFDQTSDATGTDIISMQITDSDNAIVQLSDDFIVADGELWELSAVNVRGAIVTDNATEAVSLFKVEVYADAAGSPDDDNLLHFEEVAANFLPGDTDIRLAIDVPVLGPGSYWISVYAVSPISTARWDWALRGASNQEWRINDRNNFFSDVPDNVWSSATSLGFGGLDLVFSLEGNVVDGGTSTPSELTATINASKQIELSWVDNADNETGFTIQRSVGEAADFATIGTLAPDVTSFTDEEALDGNETYDYRIIATGPISDSSPSEIASILTVPNAPTAVAISNQDRGSFSISWETDGNIRNFEVDISQDNFNTFIEGYENLEIGLVQVIDVEVEQGGDYQARVRGTNSSGSSLNSDALEFSIESLLGIAELIQLEVYPNPTASQLRINTDRSFLIEQISVTDISGKELLRRDFAGDNQANLDVSLLEEGVYIINLTSDAQTVSSRFIKSE